MHTSPQKLGRVRAVPRLCRFYPGICLTTEEKARKNIGKSKEKQCCWSDRPGPTTLLPSRSNGKPEAATAVDKLLMMGMRMPETC